MDNEDYDYESHLLTVKTWNDNQRTGFKGIPKNKILLFVSHCLIPKIFAAVERIAEKFGHEVLEVKGFSQVKKIVKERQPKAVIGIACFDELSQAFIFFTQKEIPAMGIPLTCDGCEETEVDTTLVEKVLASI